MNPSELPPAAAVLQLIAGRWLSEAVIVAAQLGVADELGAGPKSAADIANAVGAHPHALRRTLRTLASFGVFAEDDEGRFSNTRLSEVLRTGPGTLRAMAVMMGEKPTAGAWAELLYAVKTGGSPFEKVNGSSFFEYVTKNPDFERIFSEAMTSRSAMEAHAVTAAFDFSGVAKLVDIGGGRGFFLATILGKTPAQRGVLFDLPAVVAGAGPILERAGVSSRSEIVGGSFFEHVPQGDGYLLKHILHDWDDEMSVRILRAIRDAAEPRARLFVIETVLAAGNDPHFGKLLDLQMLVLTPGGRERTRSEWEALLAAGGFTMTRVVDTSTPVSVIEAMIA